VYSTLSSLLIPFIALIIVAVMIDKFTLVLQHIIKKVPFLPDEFEKPIAYLIVFAVSFLVCWRGHFCLFTYLGFSFNHAYEGWIMTSLVISGGSAFLNESFDRMGNMPGILSGMVSYASRTVTSVVSGTGSKATTQDKDNQSKPTI